MLKDLFSNRLFIGALAFLVLCVGGSMLYYQHVKEQTAKAIAESEDFKQWWQERNAKEKAVAAEVAKSDAVSEADRTEEVVSVSDAVSVPSEAEQDDFPDFSSLSPEHQQQILDQFYLQRGLKPPPKGYKYVWKKIGVVLLDDNGKPVLQKEGEPWVTIQYGIGFAPTLEEYERYQKLQDDQGWAESRGDVAEVARLTAEIEALEASVQRMRPLGTMATWDSAEAKSKSSQFSKEKLNAALREYDLEHLISPY